jgi:hypothetical protein
LRRIPPAPVLFCSEWWARYRGADKASSSFVTGIHQVKNNRLLTQQLIAHICARPAIITDLYDAAAFIDMHGDRTQLWATAETAQVRDHNPGLNRVKLVVITALDVHP